MPLVFEKIRYCRENSDPSFSLFLSFTESIYFYPRDCVREVQQKDIFTTRFSFRPWSSWNMLGPMAKGI